MSQLNDQQFMRYNRHIMMEKIGEVGQAKIISSRVLVIGMGGLGCPAAQYLTASGVGVLTLVDHDRIEISNLQRQILYTTDDIGQHKVSVAQRKLQALNPLITIEAIDASIFDLDLAALIAQHDIILDCTDSPKTRLVINQECFRAKKKLVSASAIQGSGQLISFDFSDVDSPCYQCLFPPSVKTPNNCSTSGVLSPILGVLGSMQATECLRLLLGDKSNINQLLLFDAWDMSQRKFKLAKSAQCQICGND